MTFVQGSSLNELTVEDVVVLELLFLLELGSLQLEY